MPSKGDPYSRTLETLESGFTTSLAHRGTPVHSPDWRSVEDHGGHESIYWTPCGPSLDLRLGPDFSETDWSAEYTLMSQDIDFAVQDLSPRNPWKNVVSSSTLRRYCKTPSTEREPFKVTHSIKFHMQKDSVSPLPSQPSSLIHLPTIPSFLSTGNLQVPSNANEPLPSSLEQHTSCYTSQLSTEHQLPLASIQTSNVLDTLCYARRNTFHGGGPRSVHFKTRRMEALEAGRAFGRLFTSNASENLPCHSDSQNSGSSAVLQQQTFMTSSSGSSFCLDTSASAVQPFPSTASIVRFFLNDDGAKQSSLPTGVGAVRYMDNTFNDSGFRVTLIEPPESWGSRANDRSRKPGLLRLSPDTREDPHPNDQYWHHSLLHEHLFETPSLEILDYQWTFDERLAISLLEAGLTKARRESGRPMKRPQSKYRLVAAASAKIIRATKQCFSKTLWH